MKINELTKFAITLVLLPWIPAFIIYKHSHSDYALAILSIFVCLSLLCFISKDFAQFLKSSLEKVGDFLGKHLAIIVLAIGYIIAVTPTGLLMKLVKRDRLKLKKYNTNSYWKKYDNTNTDYEYQF